MGKFKQVTISDVAKWAGVSTATISHHLNGTKRVSPAVASKIDSAIRELRYVPNANARSLKQEQTHMIGLVIPDMIIYSSICYYIESFLHEKGYNVIICNTNFDHVRENEYLNSLLERRVDGLLVATSGQNANFLNSAQESGTPVVLFDRYQPGLDTNYVLEKHRECITNLTEYLLSCNHRKIAYVKGPNTSYVSEERFQIFCEILKARGISLLPEFYYNDCKTEEDCEVAFRDIFDHLDCVTAVMLTNANQIKYLIKCARKNGIQLPKQLSFLGFGLDEYKTLFSYPITCIVQSHYDIAKNVANRILELIGSQNPEVLAPKTILVDSEFFIGKSVTVLP